MSAFDLIDKMNEAWQTGLRNQLSVPDDWQYVSSRLTEKDYNAVMECAGSDNVICASGLMMPASDNPKVNIVRFSIFISPEGINKLQTKYKKK